MGNTLYSVISDWRLLNPSNAAPVLSTIVTLSYILLLCVFLPLIVFYVTNWRKRSMLSSVTCWHNWPVVGDLLHMKLDQAEFFQQIVEGCDYFRSAGLMQLVLGPLVIVGAYSAECVGVSIKFLILIAWYQQLIGICQERRKNDQVIRFAIGPYYNLLVAYSANLVGELLSSNELVEKSEDYNVLHKWLGTGLLTSAGQKWHSRRKMLTPSFHFNILNDFLHTMNDHALNLKEKLMEFSDTGNSINVFPYITLNSLDIICSTAMGVEVNAMHAESEYVKAVYLVKDAMAHRMRKPWLWNDFLYYNLHPTGRAVRRGIDYMHAFANKVITDRHAIYNSETMQGGKRKAFLDMLFSCTDEHGRHLSFEDIREEVDTFMFEGHDTTAAAISFAIHLLGANPQALKKCHDELDEIFDDNRAVSTDDLRRMTYLEACIKEALRLFPSVPWFARSTPKDLKFAGHMIPKGTTLVVFTTALHLDPEVYPDPYKYDPTRFLAINSQNRHPYAYVPFSAGIRNCIGQKFAMMELKVVLSTLLRSFNFHSTQQRDDLKPVPGLIIQPKEGVWVKITSR